MLVETYECQETAAEPIEASEEAKQLIEQLGLEGQQSLLMPSENNLTAKRTPYPQATTEQIFVFRVLCPQQYALKSYNRTPIPLRVLQIAAHATGLEYFKEVVVWDATSAAEKDPVLVGVRQNAQRTWQDDFYLLARWGEELESWPALLKRAIERKRGQIRGLADVALRRAQGILQDGLALSDEELIEKGFNWKPEF